MSNNINIEVTNIVRNVNVNVDEETKIVNVDVVQNVRTVNIEINQVGLPGANGIGVPTGGDEGQLLSKKTNDNYDTEWVTIDKDSVGLSNVDNTSDLDKPISTATQDELDLKAPIDQPVFTGGVLSESYAIVDGTGNRLLLDSGNLLDPNLNTDIRYLSSENIGGDLTGNTPIWSILNKDSVDLSNVDNTSDVDKPVSTATQSALDLKENAANKSTTTTLGTSDVLFPTQNAVKTYVDTQIVTGTPDATNLIKGKIKLAGDLTGTADEPLIADGVITNAKVASGIDKAKVGLANVDNTSDVNKPVSTATQTALNLKANLASPTFTGTPTLPTGTIGVTQLTADNSTALATTAFVKSVAAANVADAIVDGVTTVAPSQNAVFDALTGKQNQDNLLDSISTLAGNGIIVRQNGNDAETRSIVSGSSKITVGNGSGISGNPSIDLGTVTIVDVTGLQTALDAKIGTTEIDTSAKLRAIVTDETGNGSLVFNSFPSLSSPSFTGNATVVNLSSTGFSRLGTVSERLSLGVGMLAGEKGITVRYDSGTNKATIQGEEQGLAYRNILFQPLGGNAEFGSGVDINGSLKLNNITASTALALNASNDVISVTNTGNGNNVLSNSPTLTGTANFALINATGSVTVSSATAGGDRTISVINTDNTSANSDSFLQIATGGSSSGDPYYRLTVTGVTNFTGGLDNSDSDSFKEQFSVTVGTTPTRVVTSAGYQTLPRTAAFSAFKTSDTVNATGNGTIYTVAGYTELNDQNNNFNATTGIFTAPVTGYYLFNYAISFLNMNSAHTLTEIRLNTTSRTYITFFGNMFPIFSTAQIIPHSQIVRMTAGDTARVQTLTSFGVLSVTVQAINTTFSAFLLG